MRWKKQWNLNAADKNYSQQDPNIFVPDLEKTTSRSNGEPVPSFMVCAHYLDRTCGHVAANFKSLTMNNYMNTQFLPLTSSFGDQDNPRRLESPRKPCSSKKSNSAMRSKNSSIEQNYLSY